MSTYANNTTRFTRQTNEQTEGHHHHRAPQCTNHVLLENLLDTWVLRTMTLPGLQISLWPCHLHILPRTLKVDRFMPLLRDHLCQLA